MAPSFEVLRGRDGRWLVRDGRRRFIVPDDLGAQLDGPNGPRHWRDLLAGHDAAATSRRTIRGLWLRVGLLPGSLVRGLARPLAHLASTPWLVGLALSGLAILVAAPRPLVIDPVRWPVVLVVFLGTALVHELGHAAALTREGWPPGGIGVGLLWVLPVCWCDVSAVALLPRRGRVRVDLAGVAFQLAAAGLAVLAAMVTQEAAAALGARLAVAAVIWSLLPIARTDGYWLACDLLDLPDLETPLSLGAGRVRRVVAAAWRLLTALSLAALVALLVWRLHGWVGSALPGRPVLAILARGLVAGVVLVGMFRSGRRIGRLLVAAWRDLRP